jgi:hypothetical protein
MPRPLPTAQEAMDILKAKRTRPVHRPPPTAGRSLAKLVKALDERFGQGEGGLKARWREIAGEALARRTEPVKLVKGRGGAAAVLEIRVDGPAATLIQHQAPEILERVNLFLGAGAVGRLRIVQGPVRPAAEASRPSARAASHRRKPPPLDAAAEAKLEAGLACAPDGPLKRALLRLGREVMRREH